MVKRIASFAALLLFPGMLCLNIWQSYRYQQVQQEMVRLQEQQIEILEKNKRALAALAVYSSPSRIGDLAEQELDLEKIEPEDVVHVLRAGQ